MDITPADGGQVRMAAVDTDHCNDRYLTLRLKSRESVDRLTGRLVMKGKVSETQPVNLHKEKIEK